MFLNHTYRKINSTKCSVHIFDSKLLFCHQVNSVIAFYVATDKLACDWLLLLSLWALLQGPVL